MDKSNGYEGIASHFLKGRGIAINGIGKSAVRKWALTLQPGSIILDVGCGTGIPVSKVLVDAGMIVYGIDASPTLANAFHENFPDLPITCEAAEESAFTSTYSPHTWIDIMTDQPSISLGAEKYRQLTAASGLSIIDEFEDEGSNYYFDSVKSD